jgi:16S rRNA (cytosine967-C5)-methyltransferase
MTPSARVSALIELVEASFTKDLPADAVVRQYFLDRRYIGSSDRRWLADHIYDLWRHRARLEWWLDQTTEGQDDDHYFRRLTLLYLFFVRDQNLESLNDLFDGSKYAPHPLTEPEKTVLHALKSEDYHHDQMPEHVRLECPAWAEDGLRQTLGDRFAGELKAMCDEAPLDLRINPLKITRDQAIDELKDEGVVAFKTPYSPWGLRVEGERPPVTSYPIYQDGRIEIQDEGSQMVALITQADGDDRVVDFCAGAGGKTLAIGAAMGNAGRIVATDVYDGRLRQARKRIRRADLHNVETKTLSSERDKWVKQKAGSFDIVLIDAPCSGTGTWRRNPDMRWHTDAVRLGPDLDELVELQANILQSAARLTKPGGRVIYATCSMLVQENQDQINTFLARHDEFSVIPMSAVLENAYDSIPDGLKDHGEFLQMTPAKHYTDGFFAAALKHND